jgi:membrane dipeptidase
MRAYHQTAPRPPLSLVADHVSYLIAVGGEDCVGLGGDLDGTDSLPQGMDSVADYPKIVDCLRAVGLTEPQIEKVCRANLQRVFEDVLR